MSLGCDEWCSGVKPYLGISCNQGVCGEPNVGSRIFHDKDLRLQNPMRAKGDVARSFAHRCPELGFEPLAIVINQADRRDCGPANLRSQQSDVVKCLFWSCIKDVVVMERTKSLCFVRWQWGDHGKKPLRA